MQFHFFHMCNQRKIVMFEHQKEYFSWNRFWGKKIFFQKIIFKFFKILFQLSVTHDDIFGDYSCEAKNKMGKLTRKVTLSEGAKAGIPMMQIAKVNRESTTFTILVRRIN